MRNFKKRKKIKKEKTSFPFSWKGLFLGFFFLFFFWGKTSFVFAENLSTPPQISFEKPSWCKEMSEFTIPEKSSLISDTELPTCLIPVEGETPPEPANEKGYPIHWDIPEGLELLFSKTKTPYVYEFYEKSNVPLLVMAPSLPLKVEDPENLSLQEKKDLETAIRKANPDFKMKTLVSIHIDHFGNATIFNEACNSIVLSKDVLLANPAKEGPISFFSCPFKKNKEPLAEEDHKDEETSEDVEEFTLTVYYYEVDHGYTLLTQNFQVKSGKTYSAKDFVQEIKGYDYAYTDEETFTPTGAWNLNLFYKEKKESQTSEFQIGGGYNDSSLLEKKKEIIMSPDFIALKAEINALRRLIPPFSVVEELNALSYNLDQMEKQGDATGLSEQKEKFNLCLLRYIRYKTENNHDFTPTAGRLALIEEIKQAEDYLTSSDFNIVSDGKEGDYFLLLYTLNEAGAMLKEEHSDEEFFNKALSLSGYRLKLELSKNSEREIIKNRLLSLLNKVKSYPTNDPKMLSFKEGILNKLNSFISSKTASKQELLKVETEVLIQLKALDALYEKERKSEVVSGHEFSVNEGSSHEEESAELSPSYEKNRDKWISQEKAEEKASQVVDHLDELPHLSRYEKENVQKKLVKTLDNPEAQKSILEKAKKQEELNAGRFELSMLSRTAEEKIKAKKAPESLEEQNKKAEAIIKESSTNIDEIRVLSTEMKKNMKIETKSFSQKGTKQRLILLSVLFASFLLFVLGIHLRGKYGLTSWDNFKVFLKSIRS